MLPLSRVGWYQSRPTNCLQWMCSNVVSHVRCKNSPAESATLPEVREAFRQMLYKVFLCIDLKLQFPYGTQPRMIYRHITTHLNIQFCYKQAASWFSKIHAFVWYDLLVHVARVLHCPRNHYRDNTVISETQGCIWIIHESRRSIPFLFRPNDLRQYNSIVEQHSRRALVFISMLRRRLTLTECSYSFLESKKHALAQNDPTPRWGEGSFCRIFSVSLNIIIVFWANDRS